MKKKVSVQLTLILVLLLALTGCVDYAIGIRLIEPKPTGNPVTFENENFSVSFAPDVYPGTGKILNGINFNLVNKSSSNLKILWNKATFTTVKTGTTRAIPGKLKGTTDFSGNIEPSIVPPKVKTEEIVYPASLITYNDEEGLVYTDGIIDINLNTTKAEIEEFNGQKMSVVLPIKIGGKEIKKYKFTFEIKVGSTKK